MSREIGPKEAAMRAQREANFASRKQPRRAQVADLKTAINAVPVKRTPKAGKKRL